MSVGRIWEWREKNYDKFLIIKNHDMQAGFGALILYALNGIRTANHIDAIPIIDFDAKNASYFHDATKGDSVWEYYFEPISPYTITQVLGWQEAGVISDNAIIYLTSEEAARTHQHDHDRLATFWAWETPDDRTGWMKEKRGLGREYVQNYIRPKKVIKDKVQTFSTSNFESGFIIGLHIRGTDFAYAKPTAIKDYLKEIERLLEQREPDDYRVFVATDQKQYLEVFKGEYGEKVLSWDAIRSQNHIAPFRSSKASGYRKGEDVLIDILLLSKCDYIIKGAAATGELALWFCNHNNITDFALQSEFSKKQYDQLRSTYTQLNVGDKNDIALRYDKMKERIVRKIISSKFGKVLFTKSSLIRKLLKH